MRGLITKSILSGLLGALLIASSASNAGVNPFKKSKVYVFAGDIAWYENNDTAIKTGSVKDGSDTNYYHLNIDKHQLLLRLGKNDPSGEIENTRTLDNMTINNVKVDGEQLPRFRWCLQNQQRISRKLKQNSIVTDDACINAGGGGDFVINLDDETKRLLLAANQIEFVVEPYGRPIKLVFSMAGYASIMSVINKPAPIVKAPEPVKVIAKPKPKVIVKAKPRPVVKSKPKPKPVKMCVAKPPAEFKKVVESMTYPCRDKAKKSSAEKKISTNVESEKKKAAAEIAAAEKEVTAKQKAAENTQQSKEWDKKQSTLWVSRCQRHWKKNRSPCYCEKYLNLAPPGVTNTCKK